MPKEGVSVHKMDRLMKEYAGGADNFEQLAIYIVDLARSGEEFVLVTREDSDGFLRKHKFCCTKSKDNKLYIAAYTQEDKVPSQGELYIKRIPMRLVFEFILGNNVLNGIMFNPDTAPVIFDKNCIEILHAAVIKAEE